MVHAHSLGCQADFEGGPGRFGGGCEPFEAGCEQFEPGLGIMAGLRGHFSLDSRNKIVAMTDFVVTIEVEDVVYGPGFAGGDEAAVVIRCPGIRRVAVCKQRSMVGWL